MLLQGVNELLIALKVEQAEKLHIFFTDINYRPVKFKPIETHYEQQAFIETYLNLQFIR